MMALFVLKHDTNKTKIDAVCLKNVLYSVEVENYRYITISLSAGDCDAECNGKPCNRNRNQCA